AARSGGVTMSSVVVRRRFSSRPVGPDSVFPDPRTRHRVGLKPEQPPARGVLGKPVVAVVDSGMMVTHPDLEPYLWRGTIGGQPRDYGARCIGGARDPDVTDQDGHGTRLAGTILTVTGDAPVQLMAVKFFDADALPGPANGAAAIDFA